MIFSLLVGGIGAAIGSAGGGARRGDRVRGRRAAELLRARAAVPQARRQACSTRGSSGRSPRATGSATRRTASGGGSATASPPRRAAWRVVTTLVLLVLSAGLLQLDTGLTSGNSFRGEVEAVRGSTCSSAHFPAGRQRRRRRWSSPTAADVEPVRAALEDDPAVAAVGEPVRGPAGRQGRRPAQGSTRTRPRRSSRSRACARRSSARAATDVLVGGATAAGLRPAQVGDARQLRDHPDHARRRVRDPRRAAARAGGAGRAGRHRDPVVRAPRSAPACSSPRPCSGSRASTRRCRCCASCSWSRWGSTTTSS